MRTGTYDRLAALARAAQRRFAPPPGLPACFALTDPQRTPDPLALARKLPRGTGLILRHYGRPDQIALAPALARIARQRGLVFLIAGDPRLARQVGAAGVHWPQRCSRRARVWARRRPDWLMTASAHARHALTRPAPGIAALLLSPVFDSDSPSAGRALGTRLARRWARAAPLPVLALGGVNAHTLNELDERKFAGIAAVSAQPQQAL